MIASWKARKTVHRNNERKVTKEGKKNVKEEEKKTTRKPKEGRKEGRVPGSTQWVGKGAGLFSLSQGLGFN